MSIHYHGAKASVGQAGIAVGSLPYSAPHFTIGYVFSQNTANRRLHHYKSYLPEVLALCGCHWLYPISGFWAVLRYAAAFCQTARDDNALVLNLFPGSKV